MSDEELSSARERLFWALAEHSQADQLRLQQLINTVSHRNARELYDTALRALGSNSSEAIDGIVAELERLSAKPLSQAESSSRAEASSVERASSLEAQQDQDKPHQHMSVLSMHQQPRSIHDVVPGPGPQLARITTRPASSRPRLEETHYAAGPSSVSPSHAASKFAELSLHDADAQQPATSAHPPTVAARLLSKAGAVAQDPLTAASTASVFSTQLQQHQHPARMHTHSATASTALLHQQFHAAALQPRPHQAPVPQPLQIPPVSLMQHSQPPQVNPLVNPDARQFMSAADASSASLIPPHMHPSMHMPLPPGASTPQPLYSTIPLEPELTVPVSGPSPYVMRHPASRQTPSSHPLEAAAAPVTTASTPGQHVPSIPNWCVVTGLPSAKMPPTVPPDGVLNIVHLLPWPLAVRSMLQRGVLGITLDPTVRETRGQIDQPSVMMMVTRTGEFETVLTGITYRDMYTGRQNLSEPWRMPSHWDGDNSELRVRDLDCVRLVLSHEGLNLLSSSFEPFFLVIQSALTSLGTAPSDAFAGGGETEVGKLLWETIRTSMDSLQRVTDTQKQHTAASRPAESRAGSSSEALRGGWLQRLNHEKQKLALVIDWHDRQQPDLTWVSTLVINGKPVKASEACVKKQDARDSAARMYLISIGIHGHD